MHNDTLLGVSMHLKELDRQAGSTSRSLGPRARNTGRATAIGAAAGALLRRICEAVKLRSIIEGQSGAPQGHDAVVAMMAARRRRARLF